MQRLIMCGIGLCLMSLRAPDAASAQTFDTTVYYQLRAAHSGKCLDLPSFSVANNTALQQYDCNAVPQVNQLWRVLVGGSGLWRIVSANSAKCLDIAGLTMASGALAQQYECNPAGQANQVFTLTASATPGAYRISASNTGGAKCLDVAACPRPISRRCSGGTAGRPGIPIRTGRSWRPRPAIR
jgi:hypothetical protein